MAVKSASPSVDDRDYWTGKTLPGFCQINRQPSWRDVPIGSHFGSGGSAHIYEVDQTSSPKQLAKMFVSAMRRRIRSNDNDTQRLIPLVREREAIHTALPFATWPRRLLFERKVTSQDFQSALIGYTMTRLQGVTSLQDITRLKPKRVRLTRQNAKSIALSLVTQIDALHAHPMRFVFGDFNPLNVQISHDYKSVIFIDTDAFQFQAPRKGDPNSSRVSYYVPGVNPNYVSPETADFKEGTLISPDSDLFILAIHLFRLTMAEAGVLDVHPFIVAKHSISELVSSRSFPYASPHRFPVHKHCVDAYNALPLPFRKAFERTFTSKSPTPCKEWISLINDNWRFLQPRPG